MTSSWLAQTIFRLIELITNFHVMKMFVFQIDFKWRKTTQKKQRIYALCFLPSMTHTKIFITYTKIFMGHDDVIKWNHFPRDWQFVRGIHQSPVYSPHKGQWRGALMFPLICAWINGWVNSHEAGALRRHRAHNDVSVMYNILWPIFKKCFVMYNILWPIFKKCYYFAGDIFKYLFSNEKD